MSFITISFAGKKGGLFSGSSIEYYDELRRELGEEVTKSRNIDIEK